MDAAIVASWNSRDERVATGTFLLAAVAAVAALLLLTRSHNGDTPLTHRQVTRSHAHGHLVFGMTPNQVLRRTGKPTRTHGNCWFFAPTKTGIVGSISIDPSWSRLPFNPKTQGDLKLCFTSGHYSSGYQHMFDAHKRKWTWYAWPLTLRHGSTDFGSGV